MDPGAVFIDFILSLVVLAATGYHAVLATREKLSYFHSIRYLLMFSYISFGAIVASDLVLGLLSDVALASFVLRISISAVIAAASLFSIATTVLTLQAKRNKSPYREIIRGGPPALLVSLAINSVASILVWTVFKFEFNPGEKLLLGTPTLIPHYDIFQLTVFSFAFVGFVWNQIKLSSKDTFATQPESLFKVIRATGLLSIAMSAVLVTTNVVFRTLGVDFALFGYLLNSVILGYLAYIYAKPTALLEFLASDSPLAVGLKRRQFSKVLNFGLGSGKKILLEVDSVSNYTDLAYYFLDSDWKPGVCVTYRGSPFLLSGPSKGIKIIELSISAEHTTLSKNETIEAPLFKKNTYDLLKWAVESNPEGHLVLDGLTHLIQLLGIDEVYSIVTYISELCARNGVQLLLILNYQVHKLEVLSSFEGMVDCVIQLEKNGTKQIKPITQILRAI